MRRNKLQVLHIMFLLDFYYILGSEPEIRISSTNSKLAKSSDCSMYSTPKPSQCPTVPSTGELYRTLRLIPDSRYFNLSHLLLFLHGTAVCLWLYFYKWALVFSFMSQRYSNFICVFLLVPQDTQIELFVKTPATLKMNMLESSQKTELEAET